MLEPIAIVGMSCRLPGAGDPESFWRLLAAGRRAIGEIPAERLAAAGLDEDELSAEAGARFGGFLEGVDRFDPAFFGISPREAKAMDPQQRLALELAWEALEDAGIVPGDGGEEAGVFLGAIANDYSNLTYRYGREAIGRHTMTGLQRSIIANRISYVLGLGGPSLTVDAAQSSSLVAVHLACESLRRGEAQLALAGGVHLNLDPRTTLAAAEFGGLSPDGRCHVFDARANGFVRGEGGGIVVLKPLALALADGDRVRGVVRGSAVNNDGSGKGLTVPSREAQESVVRRACARGGLERSEVQYVELHGTGTAVGDPIEAAALGAALGAAREEGEALRVGSAKTNVGHLEGAAGIVGLIKAMLAIERRELPASLDFEQPNPEIPLADLGIRVQDERGSWPCDERPLVAGVSSFGVGGTNCHLVLAEPPAVEPASSESQAQEPPLSGALLLPLSARSEPALREVAARLLSRFEQDPDLDPTDVAYTLATGRAALERRAAVLGEDREGLLASLSTLAAGGEGAGILRGLARGPQRDPVFLFPGQGAQFAGMAVPLIESSPAFARRMRECELALSEHVEWSLEEVLRDPDGAWLERLDVVQPALFAVMVSLAGLWRECGVRPAAVVGHSQGEIAAAHVAGALSLADAARVVALRGRAMAKLAGRGGMLSVSLPPERAQERIAPFGESISIAAVNGPASLVLSGEPDALGEILAACEAEGVRARRVAVDYAAHSAQIDALEPELLEAFAPISPQRAEVPILSTVSGEEIDGDRLDAEYWYRNLRETVRFEAVARSLLEQGHRTFVEVGPHPVLGFGLAETVEDVLSDPAEATAIPTLRREDGGATRFAASLGQAHAAGAGVEWEAFFAGTGARRVALPTYPFQGERYWLAPAAAPADPSALGLAPAEHPLLGAVVEATDGDGVALSGRVSLATHPWLADHAVGGVAVLPGTAFLELALAAAARVGCETVEDLTLGAPLALREDAAVGLRVTVADAGERGEREIAIHSRPEGGGEWTRHATGSISPRAVPADALGSWPPPGAEPLDVEDLYEALAGAGFEYGPAFRGLAAAWRDGDAVCVEASLPEDQARRSADFALHPALLDAVLHGVGLLGAEGLVAADGGPRLPFSWSGVSLRGAGPTSLRAAIRREAEGGVSLALAAADGTGLGQVASLALREADLSALGSAAAGDLTAIEWRELAAADGEPEGIEVWTAPDGPGERVAAARGAAAEALAALQGHLDDASPEARLAIVTSGAVAVRPGESPDPAGAAIWGLVRSAQSEHPGRFALVDTDGGEASRSALAMALAAVAEEPQLALREGALLVPRVVPLRELRGELTPPPGTWRLEARERGTLESLDLIPAPEAATPLGPGEVRIAMAAAGLNFREVLAALGYEVPGGERLGGEGSGVVLEAGLEAGGLAPGDRVMGMIPAAFGPLAVADAKQLMRVPAGWTFAQAAAVPIVFATATHALCDLAELRPGERVLIHAAAGGVGGAAVQLARHLGAEVFATASPAKWGALEALGVRGDRIASSRDVAFGERFLEATGGKGVDVVLNSLAGEFVDASLGLLPRGGRFLEMGRTDLRDPERVAAEHPGISYRAFDVVDLAPERLGELLGEVLALFEQGALSHPPIASWDLRRAPEAFRHLREGANLGKVVLEVPRPLDPDRTVLITGGTSGLGALLARHLAAGHGARHLLLASRSGPEAEGVEELRAELEGLGASVEIAACDVSRREQLAELIDSIPPERPLGAVIHAAGTLDDGVLESLDAERIERVFAPKADAAWHLHELTAEMDLSAFVLFSSAVGVLGGPGQANYAAANCFLDALAARRRTEGLPALSIAWGLWQTDSGMTSRMQEADRARMGRSGIAPIFAERGLALFDAALASGRAEVMAAPLDRGALRSQASAGALSPLLADLVRAPRRQGGSESVAGRLAAMGERERELFLLELVRREVAAVLAHGSPRSIEPERAFKEMGFDSLAAVELRNRLGAVTGVRLAATAVFDHPTAARLGRHLLAGLAEGAEAGVAGEEPQERAVREALASIPIARLRRAGLLDSLIRLSAGDDEHEATGAEGGDGIDEMDVEQLVREGLGGGAR